MFAIVESGGKQIKAVPGHSIDLERLPQNKGEKVSLKNVLLISSEKDLQIGNPYISGAVIHGHVLEQKKDKKIIVYKMRPKKGTRKKQGHRQWYSRVSIDSIELNGKIISTQEAEKQRKKEEVKIIAGTSKEKAKEKPTKQKGGVAKH